MKTLELEQIGVQEMDAVEIKETDGGLAALWFAVSCIWYWGYAAGAEDRQK